MDLLGSILGKMEKPPVIKKSAEEQEQLKSTVNFKVRGHLSSVPTNSIL